MIAVFTQNAQESGLLQKLKVLSTKTAGPTTIYMATLNGRQLLVADTGWCKVNIGAAAALVCNAYPVDNLICFGCCGVLESRGMTPGSVAIANSTRQYDVDFSPLGVQPSLIIGLTQAQYPCDDRLVTLATEQAGALGIPCFNANIGSADSFLADGDAFYALSQKFGMDTADSEAAALGEYAFECHLPYVAVKGVSNYGNDCAADMEAHYHASAAHLAGEVVYRMLDVLTGGSGCLPCSGKEKLSLRLNLTDTRALTGAECLTVMKACHTALLTPGTHGETVAEAFSIKEGSAQLRICVYVPQGSALYHLLKQSETATLCFTKEGSDALYQVTASGSVKVYDANLTVGCNKNMAAVCITVQTTEGTRCALCTECAEADAAR